MLEKENRVNKKLILAGVAVLITIGVVTGIAVMVYGNSLSEASFDQKSVNINGPVEPNAASDDHGDSTGQQPQEPSSQDKPGDSDQPANGTTDDPQGGDQNDSNPDNVVKP